VEDKGEMIMDSMLLSTLMVGFFLGIKHALEPDHVVAVSTLASESRNLKQSSIAGVVWGIGHSLTILIIGLLVFMFNVSFPERLSWFFELLVGMMIISLGISSMIKLYTSKNNQNDMSKGINWTYTKSGLIGLLHGLAGSGAMMILIMTTVATIWESILYILIFGVGTVLGMLLFTTLLGLPYIVAAKTFKLNTVFSIVASVVSTLFGIYYICKVSFLT
jgi:hypothetical protein